MSKKSAGDKAAEYQLLLHLPEVLSFPIRHALCVVPTPEHISARNADVISTNTSTNIPMLIIH
jgi:hypothetical protein